MELKENCDSVDRRWSGGVGTLPLAPSDCRGVIGVVVIGRNEGERLACCLKALAGREMTVVYADSGSTDRSVQVALEHGAEVVTLDAGRPFTAARGRNEGFARLMQLDPNAEFVQFIDGDVELDASWLDAAAKTLADDESIAAVCGRLREKYRDRCVYARLCDMEWNGPVGEIRSCGGISMMRVDAFRKAGGFDASLAAGEEAQLCGRLRSAGQRIMRIDAPMGTHDAGIQTLAQWSRRAQRAGRAYGKALFAAEKDLYKRKQAISAVVWGAAVPAMMLLALLMGIRWRVALAGVPLLTVGYGLLLFRIYRSRRRQGDRVADARLYSMFCLISKWPQLWGQIQAWLNA